MKRRIATIGTLLALSVSGGSTAQATSTASVHKASIHQKTRSFKIDIDYPRLKGLPHSAEINAELLKLVKGHVAEFNSSRSESVPSSFIGRFQIASATPDIVSIRFTFENRCPADGRPLETFGDFNYCPKNSETIDLDDIFNHSVKYADLLSVLSLDELINKEELDLILPATSPSKENFEDFTISALGLVIHFGGKEEAESSAGAMGEHTVHVPWAAVKDLLSPTSPVYQVALAADSRSAQPPFKRDTLDEQIATIATGAYSKLIDKAPDSPLGYRKRAEWHKKLGHTALAEADSIKADELDSRQRKFARRDETRSDAPQTTSAPQMPAKRRSEPIGWYLGGALLLIGLGGITVWSRRRKKKATGTDDPSADRP